MRPARQADVVLRLVGRETPPASLDAVYRKYCRYVAAVVLKLAGRDAEVDNVVQDVFVEAARGIGGLREPEAIRGWLATIAVRVVRRHLRLRRLRRLVGLDRDADYAAIADHAASPVDKMLVGIVYRVLDNLAVEDRLAFSLHAIEGEKLEAVAKLCGCSCATAKRRIARALGAIQERLADE